jgi:hypothetical protein
VPDDHDAADKAMELLVYGPLGFALYLRDTAPSFLKLFVSRGRAVLDEQRKSVEGQLGQARSVGEFATNYGGPQIRRLVNDGLARARERAEEAIEALSTLTANPGASPASDAAPTASPAEHATVRYEPAVSSPPRSPTGSGGHLAIPDYDELSASQVIEHLDGLSRPELHAIREYEAAHRARNTVIGKIEQLTRPVA